MAEKEELKKALDAFKKRLKLMRQDDESRIRSGPFSSGAKSSVAGIRPPHGFPPEIWEELADAGRLNREPGGTYSLPAPKL
jgi:hypothetical protein